VANRALPSEAFIWTLTAVLFFPSPGSPVSVSLAALAGPAAEAALIAPSGRLHFRHAPRRTAPLLERDASDDSAILCDDGEDTPNGCTALVPAQFARTSTGSARAASDFTHLFGACPQHAGRTRECLCCARC
jgi:hypothetical protein